MTEYVNSIIKLDQVKISPSYGSVAVLNDKRLMWVWGQGHVDDRPLYANLSEDEGRTWSAPETLKLVSGQDLTASFETQLTRLPGESLALVVTRYSDGLSVNSFHVSSDEGVTWSDGVDINPPGTDIHTNHDNTIVLRDGRIVMPAYAILQTTVLADNPKAIVRFGEEFTEAGRGSLAYGFAYYSDDQGQTWVRSRNEAFVMLDEGLGGVYSVEEPAIVELKDGRIMMLCRTHVGQFFKSYSPDRGESWTEPEPTGLACYPAPCNVKRIPSTGDLLVVWNQISRWEIMSGLYRHRLTCAVSKDEGETWTHHRNLESLDDTAYIEADEPARVIVGKYKQPIDRSRYHRAPGPLRHNEPTVAFLDDKVVITYGLCVFGDRSILTDIYGVDYDDLMRELGVAPHDRGNKVRVLSTDWFYQNGESPPTIGTSDP